MEEDVAEVARKLRRDAKASGAWEPALRRFGGWKLALTYGRKGGADAEAVAEKIVSASLGPEFLEHHKKVGPKPDPLDVHLFRWHLSASWARSGQPAESDRVRLGALVAALGVPEDLRKGEQPIVILQTVAAGMTMHSLVTHWRWDEPIEAHA